jgi:hypothetical protein
MTVINAYGQYYRVWVVFFFTVVYSMMGHMVLYFFEEKRKQWKVNMNDDPSELTEVEISSHTVLLRNLNPNLSLQKAQEKIDKVFKELL